MSLDRAIEQLQAEVDAFKQGTRDQPAPGTTEWFILRAKASGLSMLKRVKQLGIEADPVVVERYYRKASKETKQEDASEPA